VEDIGPTEQHMPHRSEEKRPSERAAVQHHIG
jgi:hypothetical protein